VTHLLRTAVDPTLRIIRCMHGWVLPLVLIASPLLCYGQNAAESVPAGSSSPHLQPPAAASPGIPEYPQAIQLGSPGPDGQLFWPSYGQATEMLTIHPRCGVHCDQYPCGRATWRRSQRPIPWEVFAQGEYIGPSRLPHVPVYRLRVDDILEFVYRLSGEVATRPYRLNVRDRLLIESLLAPDVVNREVFVEPDGTITLNLLGQVRAAGYTIEELRKELDNLYSAHVVNPTITVQPVELNSNLTELRASVDRRFGAGGQATEARVSPDGTIQLPAIGAVPAQGLTLAELENEIEARYAEIVEGMEVTPILRARAPRYIYVVGEVKVPGRYVLEAPTTAMQAIALAGGWNVGAHLRQMVVFRRDENWRLMATRLHLFGALYGNEPCPASEIWLRDSDIVVVPKSPILTIDDFIELAFTRGLYGVLPTNFAINFSKLSTL